MYTCGSTLEMSRDIVTAGQEQLVSCTAEQSKYCFICTATFTRFAFYEFGSGCGDILGAMARITPSQPNEAIAHIASRNPVAPMVNNKFYSK
jgi:hypothetical protein